MIADSAGNLYGTTYFGGNASNAGIVFQLTPNSSGGWTETVLYAFCPAGNCADGANPAAGLIMDSAGKLYGTASKAGNKGKGVVFQLTPGASGWSYQVLYRFCPELTGCSHGADPEASLVMDNAGNLYGTTYVGGGNGIFIVDRKTLEIVGNIAPAGIIGPGHEIATDSKGNLYIAQTTAGMQKQQQDDHQ